MIQAFRRIRQRIAPLLFFTLTVIGLLVLAGLLAMTSRLVAIQKDLQSLRDTALPRMVKLSQLSQEAAATISIAPALSANPTRFEFETLLSRIEDKEVSQRVLVDEIEASIRDPEAAGSLRANGDRLMDNLQALTSVVGDQIDVRRSLDGRVEYLRRLEAGIGEVADSGDYFGIHDTVNDTRIAVLKTLQLLLDPNSARLPRNKSEVEAGISELAREAEGIAADDESPGLPIATQELLAYWSEHAAAILAEKRAELANAFQVKALVEENSLVANRLLVDANNAFWGAGADLEAQISRVDATTRYTLIIMACVVLAFGVGNVAVWFVLRRRVFERLDRMRDAIRLFADTRDQSIADPINDEIGEISGSLSNYMAEIEQRESELQQLSNQLSKYLSPQVYDSIFRGEKEVKVASTRKKLTIFFSDIAGFTETADRLESEELTSLLNEYLTEMSRIALEYGATIDKYIGDAILVFFGDPQTRGVREDALACVRMAIGMRARMRELQANWRDAGIERPLEVRMGIHTGFCTVGNFGSDDRMDYTIVGGAVNTASRLETQAAPGEILISYETFAHVRQKILCEEHGEIQVRGIAYPVATYRVVDSVEHLRTERGRFHEKHPNIEISLDLHAMTAADRQRARTILDRASAALTENEG